MFLTETGDMMTGDDVVKLIEYIATQLGKVLVLKGGVRRYGKHSWRATGAVYFAALGLNMHKIGMLARWASPILLHYARVAPLKTLTDDFKKLYADKPMITRTQARSIEDKLKVLMDKPPTNKANTKDESKYDKKLNDLANKFGAIHDELQAKLDAEIKNVLAICGPRKYVKNKDTKVMHKVLSTIEESGRDARAFCSFKYARAKTSMHADCDIAALPKSEMCGTCCPEAKEY